MSEKTIRNETGWFFHIKLKFDLVYTSSDLKHKYLKSKAAL